MHFRIHIKKSLRLKKWIYQYTVTIDFPWWILKAVTPKYYGYGFSHGKNKHHGIGLINWAQFADTSYLIGMGLDMESQMQDLLCTRSFVSIDETFFSVPFLDYAILQILNYDSSWLLY